MMPNANPWQPQYPSPFTSVGLNIGDAVEIQTHPGPVVTGILIAISMNAIVVDVGQKRHYYQLGQITGLSW